MSADILSCMFSYPWKGYFFLLSFTLLFLDRYLKRDIRSDFTPNLSVISAQFILISDSISIIKKKKWTKKNGRKKKLWEGSWNLLLNLHKPTLQRLMIPFPALQDDIKDLKLILIHVVELIIKNI